MVPTTVLARAIEQALRAPSVHNTQPWRWRLRSGAIALHADPGRHLIATDPDQRDLFISCGAALHHVRVALAASGVASTVHRLPDPEDSTHLAAITPIPGPPDPALARLAAAIDERRTERRQMSARPVDPALLQGLVTQATRQGARLVPVTDPGVRRRLDQAIAEAADEQPRAAGYTAELHMWTHRYGADGIPTSAIAVPPPDGPTPLRRFPDARLAQPPRSPGPDLADASVLVAVVTAGDTRVDRLRAGEATSAVLLAATRLGLATTPLSQVTEMAGSRHRLQQDVLGTPEHPQLLVRVGWPRPGLPLVPVTPRRALHLVLDGATDGVLAALGHQGGSP